MTPANELSGALNNANVRAALRVIRAGETTQDDQAYRWLYGSTAAKPILFDSFTDHPRQAFQSKWGWTSAAGAYQAMCAVPGKVRTDTWGDFIKAVGPRDFSPPSQDLFAVWCIKRRGALDLLMEGRFDEAVQRLGKEWASLPGSPYGQPTRTLEQARAVYVKYGGTFAPGADAPSYRPNQIATPSMPIALALLQVFGPALSNLVPQIGKFLSNPDVVSRNLDAAQAIVDTVVDVAKKPDLASAIEAMKSDPALAKEVATAVVAHPEIIGLVELGGGIAAARDANLAVQNAEKPFYYNPAFIVTVLLFSFPLMLCVDLFYVHPDSYEANLRTQIVTGILACLTVGGAYWLGSSVGSAKKDDTISQQASK